MRDLKFACPHCEQHIQCEDTFGGQTIPCPACGKAVLVPPSPDEHHLRLTTGRVPVPAHAHGAPRAGEFTSPSPPPAQPEFSKRAIASISLSCASIVLGPFGCILGIIFGHLARAELRQNPRLLGTDLAKAGLRLGYGFLILFTIVGLWLTVKLVLSRH